ncbi:hypothetical protein HMPREF0322_03024 [Desulfitobacterium hafniense DP7]|uniref:Uncharacterized protein n=1 Tax=Desulfitobacterium hafniense DP7 TaxID=537010 RepID=G9XPX8_DESHA|nr:hypothetical protein HMPREF0322_03024 [Desulfitobacterium hafniense DP7]
MGLHNIVFVSSRQEREAEFMNGEPFRGLKVITAQDENRDLNKEKTPCSCFKA